MQRGAGEVMGGCERLVCCLYAPGCGIASWDSLSGARDWLLTVSAAAHVRPQIPRSFTSRFPSSPRASLLLTDL